MNDTPDQSPERDPWESEMSSEFERRVRDLHEAPLDLSHVKGKAMHIRRKRQAFVTAGVVAVAAAVVPIALLVTDGAGSDGSIPPAAPSTSIVDTPTDTPTESTTQSTAPVVPDAAALGFGYVSVGDGNAVLHEADGAATELPGPDYTSAADLGTVIAAYRQDENGEGFVDTIDQGEVAATYDVRSQPVITPTGSAMAFLTTDGELVVLGTDGEESSFGSDFGPNDYPAALIGDGDCQQESGCHPFLNDGAVESPPYEINYEGPNTDVVDEGIKLNDATDDWLATIQISYSDTGSCGGLFDREAQEYRFTTCEFQVKQISPQGDLVVGAPAYGDGPGDGFFAILDGTTGEEVARYASEGSLVSETQWLDDTHVVATVYDGARWHLVSLGTDNQSTELAEPAAGSEADPPWYLTGS